MLICGSTSGDQEPSNGHAFINVTDCTPILMPLERTPTTAQQSDNAPAPRKILVNFTLDELRTLMIEQNQEQFRELRETVATLQKHRSNPRTLGVSHEL
jgi:hypothetical protein